MRVSVALGVLRAFSVVAAASSRFDGFVLTSYREGGFSTADAALAVANAAATNIRVVEIMSTWYVDNVVNSTTISPRASLSPSDADVLAAIDNAQRNGLDVALKPHIDSLDGVWRANIGTHFTTDAQWAAFFESYTAFILTFAALARSRNVLLFNVGTELDGTHGREAEWRTVIAAVREALPGAALWLGPNWEWQGSPGWELVPFWDALDFIGVDMYAPLSSHDDPTLAEAVEGWAPIVANLTAFSASHGGKKVIFAEIGYASWQHAATDAPGCCTGPPDTITQSILYQSFFSAVFDNPVLGGVFWWAWPDENPNGLPCSTDFSVYKKPAAAIVKAAYGGSPQDGVGDVPIYADGIAHWDASYSWGAEVDLTSTADPYPSHDFSAAINISGQGGAFALHAPSPQSLAGLESLVFDIRVPNSSTAFSITAFLCACNDCRNCPEILPTLNIDEYSPSKNCTVPSTWEGARVVIPIADLNPSGAAAQIQRVQIGANSGVFFVVDNLGFIAAPPSPRPLALEKPAQSQCASDSDCSLNGVCLQGVCSCDTPWLGPACVALDVRPTNASSGLFDFDSDGVHLSTWGGSVVRGDDNVWHMFAARMVNNCGIASWLSNSEIVHATADSPTGAFKTQSVIFPVWAHEPSVTRAPTGEFVMHFTGNNASGVLPVTGGKTCVCIDGSTSHATCVTGRNWSVPLLTWMSYALDPAGPWSTPVLIPSAQPLIDTNMDGVILSNGSFVGLWRDNSRKDPGPSLQHRVFAANWRDPSTYVEDAAPQLGNNTEDPTVWVDSRGHFHALVHYGVEMLHGRSSNGVDWAFGAGDARAYGHDIVLVNGSSIGAARRERPHVVIDENGRIVAVTNALQPRGPLAGANGDATFTVSVPVAGPGYGGRME